MTDKILRKSNPEEELGKLTLNAKTKTILLAAFCIITTIVGFYILSGISPDQMQTWLKQFGIWAPILFVLLYVVATVLVMPSTALNLAGGAIFGPWLGVLWTTVGALIAAIVSFVFTRTIGRQAIEKRLAGRWRTIDAEVQKSGMFYIFAIRLVPIMPYGLVNFAAGLTSVSFKDYVIGTSLGTVPGILPFVLLGSSGVKAVKTGDVFPLVSALALVGIMVAGTTWYRQRMISRSRKL